MDLGLEGKNAIVTGGSLGIGTAFENRGVFVAPASYGGKGCF